MLLRSLAITFSVLLMGACAAQQEPSDPPAGSLQVETPAPTRSPAPSTTDVSEPSVTPIASGPDDALPTMPPFAGIPTLDGHPSGFQAGCRGTLFYLTTPIHGDVCALLPVDEIHRLDRLDVAAGDRLVIEAPDGYAFSVADARLEKGWSVGIAPLSALKRGTDIPLDGVTHDVGNVVRRGLGPDKRLAVRMPNRKGTYVIELTGPLARDGWTFPGSIYYWLVEVG
jgi:hypothetical protein